MARVILVKKDNGELISATALDYETDTGFVQVQEEIEMSEGIKVTNVPKDLCYDYDPDLQSLINRLIVESEQKRRAAMQLLCEAVRARFEGDEAPVRHH